VVGSLDREVAREGNKERKEDLSDGGSDGGEDKRRTGVTSGRCPRGRSF